MTNEILVIDDNADIRLLISSILLDKGLVVRKASTYDEALNEINKKLPDVAIVDVKLDKGDNDGIEILTRIKKKDAKKGMVLTKLTELGFYDGGNTIVEKIEKTKDEKKKITKKKPTDNVDIVKQLKELNSLLESGIISAEEFAKAKKKLLN